MKHTISLIENNIQAMETLLTIRMQQNSTEDYLNQIREKIQDYNESLKILKSNVSPSSEVEKSFNHHELDIPFVQSQGGIPQDNEHEGD